MDLPIRKRLPHAIPPWVKESSFYFITINNSLRHENHLAKAGIGDAVLAAAAHYHDQHTWHCRLMLLMPDHLHAIIAFPQTPGIKRTVMNWKRYLTRTQQIDWQRDFFDHRLRTHHEEVEKTQYILMNPVRRGLCERAEEWPWVYRPTQY